MQRVHLKKARKKRSKWICFLYTILFSLLFTFFLIAWAGKKLERIIIRYATIETNRIATTILNDVIREENFVPEEELYALTKDNDGNIELLNFNTKISNAILQKVNERAMKRLLALEEGDTKDIKLSNSLKGTTLTHLKSGVICEIPLGVLNGNSLLVNSSAVVPIRFSFVGTVTSNLSTKVTPYGINNALIEIGVEVTITEQITMPHTTKSIPVTSTIPLVTQLVQGRVPSFYQDGLTKNSQSLSLPLEEIS